MTRPRSALACSAMLGLAGACGAVLSPHQADDTAAAADTVYESALRSAEHAAEIVARSLVAILPVKDLENFYSTSLPLPLCPAMQTTPGAGGDLDLTLDYEQGCNPYTLPVARVSGTVAGTVFPRNFGFDLALQDIRVDEISLDGTLSGSVARTDAGHEFVLHVRADDGDGSTLQGNCRVQFLAGSGAFTVNADSLTVSTTPAGATDRAFIVAFADVLVQPRSGSTWTPIGGAAVIESRGADNVAPTTITHQFQPP